jgi:hypothetical protein
MIINSPIIEYKAEDALIRAYIEFEHKRYLSRNIWFEMPLEYVHESMASYEPFVVAVLMVAMSMGEKIKVKGNISPRLMYGLRQYQDYFHFWFPRKLKVVDIEADYYKEIDQEVRGNKAASYFSGGVDSTYTLWSHLKYKPMIEQQQIGHCIFVQGWDIPLARRNFYESLKQKYNRLLSELGVSLLPVRSNLRELLVHARVAWGISHGTALGSLGLMMHHHFARIYIPGGTSYGRNLKWGSNPITDPLLSTENVLFVHHGGDMSRVEKVKKIADWPPSYYWLRVCWLNSRGEDNCCKCEKCLKTMVSLEVAGTLREHKTFPCSLPINDRRKWNWLHESPLYVVDDLIKYARSEGRNDIVRKLVEAVSKSNKQRVLFSIKHRALSWSFYVFLRMRDYWKQLASTVKKGRD